MSFPELTTAGTVALVLGVLVVVVMFFVAGKDKKKSK